MVIGVVAAALLPGTTSASDLDEFKVKRQGPFQFAQKPAVTRDGDAVTITFAAKAYCDATIAIESSAASSGGAPKIIRHLASGVLGPNAPPPFRKNSLEQTLLWDGKDDQGVYVDDKDACVVRVSLGLRPRFERTLFWSPYKRLARNARPLISATPEGVFVFEGEGCDLLRRYDHRGNYVRIVYPFPADKLDDAVGLTWARFPQSGRKLPLKNGLVQATLLTSGKNIYHGTLAKYQPAATAMAVHPDGRIALASERLNRLATDGTTGGRKLGAPQTGIKLTYRGRDHFVPPRSAAFSPDGKTVYLTGYHFRPKYPKPHHWVPCVTKIDFAEGGELELFAGSMQHRGTGTDPGEFRAPTSVAVDPAGRVYAADYYNGRVQIFSPEGRLLKQLKTPVRPTEIAVHQKTGRLYVASWMILCRWNKPGDVKEPTLTRFGPFDNLRQEARYRLPIVDHNPKVFMNRNGGFPYTFALDSWTDPPTFWLVPAQLGTVEKLMIARGKQDRRAPASCVHLYAEKNDGLELIKNFGNAVIEKVHRARPPIHSRQRLYVDPTTGRLYVFEGLAGVSKSTAELLEIDPRTGEVRPVQLPFDAEDACFDLNGLLYLRTDNEIGRFRRRGTGWREVPFDYGEERKNVGFSSSRDGRSTNLIASLILPAQRPGCFHQGGMHVNARGRLVVSCYNINKPAWRKGEQSDIIEASRIRAGRKYTPTLFPGRERWGEVHVWDQYGQAVHRDAFRGLPMLDGVAIDRHDNIYVLATPNRVLDGEPYLLERAETLMRAAPGKGRLVCGSKKKTRVPLGKAGRPDRPPDLRRGSAPYWAEGVDWMYGGVGFGGFNSAKGGGGCACWHARFALDLYARSFAPEVDHFSVAVLDTNGNLILRIGRYGNVDDGLPLVRQGGPPAPRSVGGDEVALFDAAYLAVHSDRRLFVADGGNRRILSVTLGYHATETVALKDVPAED